METNFGDAMRNGRHASESGRKPQPRKREPASVRHWCASRAPVRPEITGFSRTANRLNKRNPNADATGSR